MKKRLSGAILLLVVSMICMVLPFGQGIHNYLILETYNETVPVYEVSDDRIIAESFFTIYGKKSAVSGDFWHGTMQLEKYPIYNQKNEFVYSREGEYAHIMWPGTGQYDFKDHPTELIPVYPYNQYDLYISRNQVLVLFVRHYTGPDNYEDHVYASISDMNEISIHLKNLS